MGNGGKFGFNFWMIAFSLLLGLIAVASCGDKVWAKVQQEVSMRFGTQQEDPEKEYSYDNWIAKYRGDGWTIFFITGQS